MIVYFNGVFLPQTQVAIPLTNRGFLFGDGVFTTLKVKDGKPQLFPKHIERLSEHCKSLKIVCPEIKEQTVLELIARNQAFHGTWRLKILLTGGPFEGLVSSGRSCDVVLMTLECYEIGYKNYLKLVSYPFPLAKPTAKIKSIAYLDSLLVKEYACSQGCDDAIVYSAQGHLLETACCNIFWVLDNVFYTPALHLDLLSGIVLNTVKEIVEELGLTISFVEAKHLPEGAKVFVCNSLKGVQPVGEVDGNLLDFDEKFSQQLNETLNRF